MAHTTEALKARTRIIQTPYNPQPSKNPTKSSTIIKGRKSRLQKRCNGKIRKVKGTRICIKCNADHSECNLTRCREKINVLAMKPLKRRAHNPMDNNPNY